MPKLTASAAGGAMPAESRQRLEAAVERLIALLDALDAPFEDLEDGHDREEDPAEDGVADHDAFMELTGELSLGATEALNQEQAWRGPGGLFVFDGEMQGTLDDLPGLYVSPEARAASRALKAETRARLVSITNDRSSLS